MVTFANCGETVCHRLMLLVNTNRKPDTRNLMVPFQPPNVTHNLEGWDLDVSWIWMGPYYLSKRHFKFAT